METRVTEIAEGIHQLPMVVPGAPVAFDQCLVTGDEPILLPHAWEAGVLYDSATNTLFLRRPTKSPGRRPRPPG